MIQAQLFNFDKRKNSTKRPNLSDGVTFDGELKDSFSPMGLQVKFNLGALTYAPIYNYAYIPYLRRYYFITEWYYDVGFWYAVLAVDVLATYKEEIGYTTQYVSRCYSDYDASIIDTTYLTKAAGLERKANSLTSTLFWGGDISANNGLIVVGVVGSSSGNFGAVTYYAMSMQVFTAFMSSMLSSISWANISVAEISQELQKALINPTQYIVYCRWFPVLASGFTQGVATTVLNLGWWSFNLTGTAYILNTPTSAFLYRYNEIDIPKATQSLGNVGARLQYVNLSPFAEYVLEFMPFGIYQLDTTELYGKSQLCLRVDMNLMTGDAVLRVGAKQPTESFFPDRAFLVTEGQIGVPLPIGQVAGDISKYKDGLLAGASQAVSDVAAMLGGG